MPRSGQVLLPVVEPELVIGEAESQERGAAAVQGLLLPQAVHAVGLKGRIDAAADLHALAPHRGLHVLGVLIALAAQSWWEDRALEEDRLRALQLLRADVARLEGTLREREDARRVSEAIRWLLATPEADLAAAPDSVLGAGLTDALWNFGFQIGDVGSEGLLPSHADLKGSGRLHLLPDTVRALMPSVERGLADFTGFLADLVNFQPLRIDEIILDHFVLDGRVAQTDDAFVFLSPWADLGVLKTRRAQTLLGLKESLVKGILDRADSVVVDLERLSEVIASKPGGG